MPDNAQEDHSILGLATIRCNRGITLEQIAQTTKIGVRALRAIEQGEFTKLPGGIYNTSYIRQYARAIDFDEYELLAYYRTSTGDAADGSEKKPPHREVGPGLKPALGAR